MYTGTYKIAEKVIEINSLFEDIHKQCAEYRFDGAPELVVTTVPEDIGFEREKSAREDELEGIPTRHFADAYLESLAVYRRLSTQMLEHDTLLFHGSAIALDGQAVLFTAKSGTGKSTHTALWRKEFGERCFMVNDDKPLLRITDEGVLVCGTPWDGKHHLSRNCQVPLKAICILERGQKNTITPITAKEALPMIMQQSFRPAGPQGMAQLLQVVDKLTKHLAFYRLQCTISPEAAHIACQAMLGK